MKMYRHILFAFLCFLFAKSTYSQVTSEKHMSSIYFDSLYYSVGKDIFNSIKNNDSKHIYKYYPNNTTYNLFIEKIAENDTSDIPKLKSRYKNDSITFKENFSTICNSTNSPFKIDWEQTTYLKTNIATKTFLYISPSNKEYETLTLTIEFNYNKEVYYIEVYYIYEFKNAWYIGDNSLSINKIVTTK